MEVAAPEQGEGNGEGGWFSIEGGTCRLTEVNEANATRCQKAEDARREHLALLPKIHGIVCGWSCGVRHRHTLTVLAASV
jgi:hypothetical protein